MSLVVETSSTDKTTEKQRMLELFTAARDGKSFYPKSTSERQFVESLKKAGKLNERIAELQRELTPAPTTMSTKTKKPASYWKSVGPGHLSGSTATTYGKGRKTRKSKKTRKTRKSRK